MRIAAILALFATAALAQDPEEPRKLSGRELIDHEWKSRLADAGFKAAPKTDDSEFMRRVYLDLVGTIPSLDQAEKFLAAKGGDKRAKLVDELLSNGKYAENWAWIWASSLVGTNGDDNRGDLAVLAVSKTLEEYFQKNEPFTKFATDVITAQGMFELPNRRKKDDKKPDEKKPGGMMDEEEGGGMALMYFRWQQTAGRDFPMALANKFSRSFLGIQISCAQCHDHPFDKWTQEDFYGMAAFFTQVNVRRLQEEKQTYGYEIVERPARRGSGMLPLADTKKTVSAAWLDTKEKPGTDKNLRAEFARMLTSRANVQFARGVVNRYWGYMFGRGIVNPIDDFNGRNKPSHPDLLEGLAAEFIARNYDVKWLLREIANSQPYQISSRTKERSLDQEKLMAAAAVRSLTPEQILNSIIAAGLVDTSIIDRVMKAGALRQFRFAFGDDEGAEIVEFEGTIPAALMMMNGDAISRATGGAGGGRMKGQRRPAARGGLTRLDSILKQYSRDDERTRAVYLAVLSRPPSAKEMARALNYVNRRDEEGFEDLMWALMNSSEFLFNH